MRFSIELLLKKPNFPKDKNRVFMNLMKTLFQKEDEDYFGELYRDGDNRSKDFTFSTYLGRDISFLRNEIIIPGKKILLNFSSPNFKETVLFYNSFVDNIGFELPIKNNIIKVNKINLLGAETIIEDQATFITQAPICIREHSGDNEKTWYYSLDDLEGKEKLLENIKYQLKIKFPKLEEEILNEIDLDINWNKNVRVKHYNIDIPSNLCSLRVRAKPFILDYLYKAGIGVRRNQGFGYINLDEKYSPEDKQ